MEDLLPTLIWFNCPLRDFYINVDGRKKVISNLGFNPTEYNDLFDKVSDDTKTMRIFNKRIINFYLFVDYEASVYGIVGLLDKLNKEKNKHLFKGN